MTTLAEYTIQLQLGKAVVMNQRDAFAFLNYLLEFEKDFILRIETQLGQVKITKINI